MSVHHVCAGDGIMGGYGAALHVCWELNLGPLEEQQPLLTIGLSVHHKDLLSSVFDGSEL